MFVILDDFFSFAVPILPALGRKAQEFTHIIIVMMRMMQLVISDTQ